jgi:hypothetical protein
VLAPLRRLSAFNVEEKNSNEVPIAFHGCRKAGEGLTRAMSESVSDFGNPAS